MKNLKNQLNVTILSLLVISLGLALITSCEDDESNVDSLVGTYQFASVTLAEDLVYELQTIATAGTSVIEEIGTGMFANFECGNPFHTAVELRKNHEIWFVCVEETKEEKAGTWSIDDDRTVLALNLSPPVVSSQISLQVTNLNESKKSLTGTIANLPVPPELFELPPGDPLLVTVNIQFTKL